MKILKMNRFYPTFYDYVYKVEKRHNLLGRLFAHMQKTIGSYFNEKIWTFFYEPQEVNFIIEDPAIPSFSEKFYSILNHYNVREIYLNGALCPLIPNNNRFVYRSHKEVPNSFQWGIKYQNDITTVEKVLQWRPYIEIHLEGDHPEIFMLDEG